MKLKYKQIDPQYLMDVIKKEHNYSEHLTKAWSASLVVWPEHVPIYLITFEKLGGIEHWRITRYDSKPVHNFIMDLWQIKNNLIGKNRVAIKIYLTEKSFKNSSNTYHLWTWKGIEGMIPNLETYYDAIGGYENV